MEQNKPINILKRYYGYDSFRPLQEEIINHILSGQDCLTLMPTGGGKSVCFQIPALLMEGTAVVISPLISLMKDQVEALLANGIPAAAINSNYDVAMNYQTRQDVIAGKVKLLYVSPEFLVSELHGLFQQLKISLFAIDEAHCISQWGHDFRPEYTQLGQLRTLFPEVPIAAFTATADKITKHDIVKQLNLKGMKQTSDVESFEEVSTQIEPIENNGEVKIFISSFDRPNLSLDVRRGYSASDKIKTILSLIDHHKSESGIIYCLSRKTTEEVAAKLQNKGIAAGVYHAGLSPQQRDQVQNDFINDRIHVVCATIAFGMGIDKSNVRFVVHYNLPKSIENYYQEIGRGGRDGLPCETILFYSIGDIITLRKFASESGQQRINNEKLDRMQEFAESQICRRRILLNYFGEAMDHDCCNCDVCQKPPKRFDGSVLVQKALSAISRTGQKVGSHMVVDILRASANTELTKHGYHQLKTYGAGRDTSYQDWQDYLLQMLHLGYLELDYQEDSHLKITEQGIDVLYGRKKAELAVISREDFSVKGQRYKQLIKAAQNLEGKLGTPIFEPQEDLLLFEKLRKLRYKQSQEEGVPAYTILSDATLHELATIRPRSTHSFARIPGVSEAKAEKYSKAYVALIRDHINPQNTITINGTQYTVPLELWDCLPWRETIRRVQDIYYWNFYEAKEVDINDIFTSPIDPIEKTASVMTLFDEIIKQAFGISHCGNCLSIPQHIEYDQDNNPVKRLECQSFEEGLAILTAFIDQRHHYPFAHGSAYECSLHRWVQEIGHGLIKITDAQKQAFMHLNEVYAELPKTRSAWEKNNQAHELPRSELAHVEQSVTIAHE